MVGDFGLGFARGIHHPVPLVPIMGFVSVACFHGVLLGFPLNVNHFQPRVGLKRENGKIQLRTMDHSVRRSMKNAANCVKYGELQGSRNRYMSNAYGAFIFMMEARLSEGLLNGIDHLLSRPRLVGWLTQESRVSFTLRSGCFPLDFKMEWGEGICTSSSPACSRASADLL